MGRDATVFTMAARPPWAIYVMLICIMDYITFGHTAAEFCNDAQAILDSNWIPSRHSTVPSHSLYPHQWSWDSAFIAIGNSLNKSERAMDELETLFKAQWSTGLVPHIVFNPDVPDNNYFPGPDYWRSTTDSNGIAPASVNTSGLVNPPIHPTAVRKIIERDDSPAAKAFLGRIYPKLAKWMNYLASERDPDGNGLVFIRHPWESGMDNSPLWDAILEGMSVPRGSIPVYHRTDIHAGVNPADRPTNATYDRFVSLMICARNASYNEARIAGPISDGGCPFVVEDILFNALYAQAANDMAFLAQQKASNQTKKQAWAEEEIEKWHALSARILRGLSQQWSPAAGLFQNRDMRETVESSLSTPIPAVSGLMPLLLANWANLSSGALLHFEALEQTLVQKFAAPVGVPTVAPDWYNFSSHNYWRGPTWFNIDWMLARGLGGYSPGIVRKLTSSMQAMVSNGTFHEYFVPFNGQAHGTGAFSWTAALY